MGPKTGGFSYRKGRVCDSAVKKEGGNAEGGYARERLRRLLFTEENQQGQMKHGREDGQGGVPRVCGRFTGRKEQTFCPVRGGEKR